MSEDKLKPCPFCGGKRLCHDIGDWGTRVIFCMNNDCGARGPERENKDDAATAWNRRAGEDAK